MSDKHALLELQGFQSLYESTDEELDELLQVSDMIYDDVLSKCFSR